MIVCHVVVRGQVQGVGYRHWAQKAALRRELEGWVRNRRDGTVEAVFSGPADVVAAMIEACRRGPRDAHVEGVDVQDGSPELLAQRRKAERFSQLETA